MESFSPIYLSLAEKEAFTNYLHERYNYSGHTIKCILKYLKVTVARTRRSRAQARLARRRYKEFIKEKGGEDGV